MGKSKMPEEEKAMEKLKMTDEEKVIRRRRRQAAIEVVRELNVSHTRSVTACTDTDCPFCHRGICTKSKCYKDTDESKRQRMPRQISEDIEAMFRYSKEQCDKLVEDMAALIGMDYEKFKLYRKEQAEMLKYIKAVQHLEREHNRQHNMKKKLEDIKKPEMTVSIEDCIISAEATSEAIKAYMTSIDFEGWREEQMTMVENECEEMKRKMIATCAEMHITAQTECDAMKKRMELECQLMKKDAERYVQVGERIAANVDEIKRVLTGIIKEPDADVNPPKQPKKRTKTEEKPKAETEKGTKAEKKAKKVVDPVIEQMEAQV